MSSFPKLTLARPFCNNFVAERMHTSSPTDSSQSASSPATSDTPAWPATLQTQTSQIRRKPLPQHTRTGSTSTGTSAGASTGTSSTGHGITTAPATRVRNNNNHNNNSNHHLNPGKQRSGPAAIPGAKRFYSSPMTDNPTKTPLQEYGLEQREPSIFEDRGDMSSKLLRRVSHALDDIKEDFSLQLESTRAPPTPSSAAADRMRLRRRDSAFVPGNGGDGRPPPSSMPSPLGALRNGRPETAASRPLSIFSLDLGSQQGGRRLSKRLSSFGSNLSVRRKRGYGESISQPNLIGSSTQM